MRRRLRGASATPSLVAVYYCYATSAVDARYESNEWMQSVNNAKDCSLCTAYLDRDHAAAAASQRLRKLQAVYSR